METDFLDWAYQNAISAYIPEGSTVYLSDIIGYINQKPRSITEQEAKTALNELVQKGIIEGFVNGDSICFRRKPNTIDE